MNMEVESLRRQAVALGNAMQSYGGWARQSMEASSRSIPAREGAAPSPVGAALSPEGAALSPVGAAPVRGAGNRFFERSFPSFGQLGTTIEGAVRNLTEMLKCPYPAVRRAAAGALWKIVEKRSDFAPVLLIPLRSAVEKEQSEQVLLYMLKVLRKCARHFGREDRLAVLDIARNPTRKGYVRQEASLIIADAEAAYKEREAVHRHWCTRCQKIITPEESAKAIQETGKPFCRRCLMERGFETVRFNYDVEAGKKLRTIDEVAVQSRGEKRIGDFLAAHRIAYDYDQRMVLAGDQTIRPDFYLPEFDIYIEYWGMDTKEYLASMERKKFLYRRDRMKLISLSFRDFDHLEELLGLKLSRYGITL